MGRLHSSVQNESDLSPVGRVKADIQKLSLEEVQELVTWLPGFVKYLAKQRAQTTAEDEPIRFGELEPDSPASTSATAAAAADTSTQSGETAPSSAGAPAARRPEDGAEEPVRSGELDESDPSAVAIRVPSGSPSDGAAQPAEPDDPAASASAEPSQDQIGSAGWLYQRLHTSRLREDGREDVAEERPPPDRGGDDVPEDAARPGGRAAVRSPAGAAPARQAADDARGDWPSFEEEKAAAEKFHSSLAQTESTAEKWESTASVCRSLPEDWPELGSRLGSTDKAASRLPSSQGSSLSEVVRYYTASTRSFGDFGHRGVVERDGRLLSICGSWRDTKGSSYHVGFDGDGTLSVRTTRPNGEERFTSELIRLNQTGVIQWGARAQFTLAEPPGGLTQSVNQISWKAARGGKIAFVWSRLEDQGGHWSALTTICGRWSDTDGSQYYLEPDGDSTLSVVTTRPSGQEKFTKELIRLSPEGVIEWGHNAQFVLVEPPGGFTSSLSQISWRSATGRSKGTIAFVWNRQTLR